MESFVTCLASWTLTMESKLLIQSHNSGKYTINVRHNLMLNEYTCEVIKHGILQPKATYFTDDKQDALITSDTMMNSLREDNIMTEDSLAKLVIISALDMYVDGISKYEDECEDKEIIPFISPAMLRTKAIDLRNKVKENQLTLS